MMTHPLRILFLFALTALPLFAAENDKFSAEFLGVSEQEITHGETKTQVLEGPYTLFPNGTGFFCSTNVSVETARTLAEYQESWLRMECDIRTDSCNKGSMDWIIAARNVVRLPMPAFEVRRTVIPAGVKPGEPFQLFTVFLNTSQPPQDYLTNHWCWSSIESGKGYVRGNLREFYSVFQASDVVPAGYCNFWMEEIPGYTPATGQEVVQTLSFGIASLNQDDSVGPLRVKENLAVLLAQAGREQGRAAGTIQGDAAARQQESSLQISELSIKPSGDEPDYMDMQWRITPSAGAVLNVPVACAAVSSENELPHYASAFRLYGVDANGKRYDMEVKRPFGMYQGSYYSRLQELPASGAEVHFFARLASRFTPALQALHYEVLTEKGIVNCRIPFDSVYNTDYSQTPFGKPSSGFRMRARISQETISWMDQLVLYLELRCSRDRERLLGDLVKGRISILLDGEDLILDQQVSEIRTPRSIRGQAAEKEASVECVVKMGLPGRCFRPGRHILSVQIDEPKKKGERPFPLVEPPLLSAPILFTVEDPTQ